MYSVDRVCRIGAACLLGLLAGGAVGAQTPNPPQEPGRVLRIGLFEPDEILAEEVQNGALRAQSEWNRLGGVAGMSLELVRLPKTARWRDAGAQLARFIIEHDLRAVIGPRDRAAAHVAAQVATRLRTPIVTLSSDPTLTGSKDPWIFRGPDMDDERERSRSLPARSRCKAHEALGCGVFQAIAQAAASCGTSRESIREGLARIQPASARRAGASEILGKREGPIRRRVVGPCVKSCHPASPADRSDGCEAGIESAIREL